MAAWDPTSFANLRPMLLDNRKVAPFDDPDYLFEIKHDGWRMLAQFGSGYAELRTRNGHDCSTWFPEVTRTLARYPGGPHVVDGEACVLVNGRSEFDRFQDRAYRKRWYPGCDEVTFCVFDLLVGDGEVLMREPLEYRKEALAALFSPKPRYTILVVEAIPTFGKELFQGVIALQLEGLVAKHRTSVYEPGERTVYWKKLKRPGAVPAERFRRN